MVAWIALVLAGREHTLQALGVEIACVHPGARGDVRTFESKDETHGKHAPHQLQSSEDEQDVGLRATSAYAGEGEDCPAGCTDCACGAAPFVPPSPLVIGERAWRDLTFERDLAIDGPARRAASLDRPPRRS